MQAAISDGFLEELTAVGDETAVQAGLERYRSAGATSPCIGPIARTDFEATLRAGAALLARHRYLRFEHVQAGDRAAV